MNVNQPTILLAEDDPNDVFFLQRALTKGGIGLPLQIVSDGREALDYLSGAEKFSDRAQYPLPSQSQLAVSRIYTTLDRHSETLTEAT